jgi:plastocyanin
VRRALTLLPLALALLLPAAAAADAQVRIVDFGFQPADRTVDAGAVVTWTNDGATTHTASAVDGAFDVGALEPGRSGSFTFAAAGRYEYRCQLHPGMVGTIVVAGGTSAPNVVVDEPAEGARVAGIVAFNGTASDPDAGDRLAGEWWIDDETTRRPLLVPAVGGRWTAQWDSRLAQDGARVFHVKVADDAGLVSEATRTIVVANAPAAQAPGTAATADTPAPGAAFVALAALGACLSRAVSRRFSRHSKS